MTTEDILQTRYEFSIVLVKGELSRGLSCQEIVFTAKEHVVNHNNMICTFNKKLVDEMTADEPCSPCNEKSFASNLAFMAHDTATDCWI